VPKEYYGLKYKSLFKHLVIKRFMIPLGIYRTERVSFAGLDPSYGESAKSRGDDEGGHGSDKEDHHGSDGPSKSGSKEDDVFESVMRKNKRVSKSLNDIENDEKYKKLIRYVITNPDKDLELKEDDTVFVLAQNDPKDPNVFWEDQPKKGMFINFDNFSI
jgi:hypothetical protein